MRDRSEAVEEEKRLRDELNRAVDKRKKCDAAVTEASRLAWLAQRKEDADAWAKVILHCPMEDFQGPYYDHLLTGMKRMGQEHKRWCAYRGGNAHGECVACKMVTELEEVQDRPSQ